MTLRGDSGGMGTRQGGGCEGSLESGSVWEHGTCDNVGPRIGGKWGPRLGSWGAGPGLEAGPIHEAGNEVRRILSVERWEVRIGPGNTMSWTLRSVLRRGMAGLLLVPVWRAQRSAGDGRPGFIPSVDVIYIHAKSGSGFALLWP